VEGGEEMKKVIIGKTVDEVIQVPREYHVKEVEELGGVTGGRLEAGGPVVDEGSGGNGVAEGVGIAINGDMGDDRWTTSRRPESDPVPKFGDLGGFGCLSQGGRVLNVGDVVVGEGKGELGEV
jgi:hypothetical protein